jgi:hypothetical protein
MMINKLILRSQIENQIFRLKLCTSQKQLALNQFTQNTSSYFVKMSTSSINVTKMGVVN